MTASFWLYSANTLKKHRERLLKYGIDIDQPRPAHLEIKPEPPVINEPKKTKLTIVK
jgi:hypothetical protein